MSDREYKYIDVDKLEEEELEPVNADPRDVLYESLLDLIQLAAREGLTEDDIDGVLDRIHDYRANQARQQFTLHTRDKE